MEEWKLVGFQNQNPRTDFRAGGLLSLLSLVYLVKNYRKQFDGIRKVCEAKDDFSIAISSINLTSHLMSYLHMNEGKQMMASHYRVQASRSQSKLFYQMQS